MPSRKTPESGAAEDALLSPMEQLRHVVDALCEEPFESEATDEDVADARAKIGQLAKQYGDAKRKEFRDLIADIASDSAKDQLQRDLELSERIRKERREKDAQGKPPDETPPSDEK